MGAAFSAVALLMKHNLAVAEIHFREDGQCEVNGQFHEPLGEPRRKRPVREGEASPHGHDKAGGRHGRERRHRQARQVCCCGNAVAGERVKKAAELLGLLERCDVTKQVILPVAVHQHRRHGACD